MLYFVSVIRIDKSIALIPSLFAVYKDKNLGSDMVKWIVSVDDQKSPYRRLPLSEREAMVTLAIYGQEKKKRCESPLVVAARDEYQRLQFDPLVDQYNAMSDQMYEMTKVYRAIKPTAKNLDELNNLQKKMGESAVARDKTKQLILKDQESDVKIAGSNTDNFSFLEETQRLTDKK